MSKKFYRRRTNVSQISQLYLFTAILVVLLLLITTQCGLYRYEKNDTVLQLPKDIKIYQTKPKQIIIPLKQKSPQSFDFKRLGSLITSQMQEVSDIFSVKSGPVLKEKADSCKNIAFVPRKTGTGLLLALPWDKESALSALYTALVFVETIVRNNLPYHVSVLVYDMALSCNGAAGALADLNIPDQFSGSFILYHNPFQKNFLNVSAGLHDSSSLNWQDIIPLEVRQNSLDMISAATFPFFDNPGKDILNRGIPSIAIGYQEKNIFSTSPAILALISANQFFRKKPDIENRGPWLSNSIALKNGFTWIFVFLGLLLIGIEALRAISRSSQKPSLFRGLVSACYFGLPIMVFFIAIRLFSLNESISQTMTLISIAIAVLVYVLLSRVSVSLLNVREGVSSLVVVCGLLVGILIWNRPFFSLSVIPVFYILIRAKELPGFFYRPAILISLVPTLFLLAQPYGIGAIADLLLNPIYISRYLAGDILNLFFNSFTAGAFISLAIRNE